MAKAPKNKLPAALIEAEATPYAREMIARLREGDPLGIGVPALHDKAGGALLRQRMRSYALAHPINMSRVVEWAKAGWKDAEVVAGQLLAEAATASQTRGEPMSPVLVAYTVWLADAERPPITYLRARQKATNFVQDLAIVVMIIHLVERFGLKRTRFTQSRPSAYSVMADALGKEGIPRGSEKAIGKIWDRLSPLVLHGFQSDSPFAQNLRN